MIYIMVTITAVLAYWLFRDLFSPAKDTSQEQSKQNVDSSLVESDSDNDDETSQVDDLKRIYGLGPQSEKALRKAGINSFQELADIEISQLEEITYEISPLLISDSWPAQATLAANGNWDEFEAMQNNLRVQETNRRQTTTD